MQNERSTVLGDHLDADPVLSLDELGPDDVMDVLRPFLAVVRALVVETDHRLVVPHVDECLVHTITHAYLGARRRQPGVDEDESQPGLSRRLRSGVHQRQGHSGPSQSSRPAVPIDQRERIVCGNTRRGAQRIEMGHCLVAIEVAGEVQSRARKRGHGQPADLADLVGADPFLTHDDPGLRSRVLGDDLDRSGVVDPLRAMQCRGCPPGDDTPPTTPYPGRDGVDRHRALDAVGEINAREDRSVVPPQLTASEDAVANRLAANE